MKHESRNGYDSNNDEEEEEYEEENPHINLIQEQDELKEEMKRLTDELMMERDQNSRLQKRLFSDLETANKTVQINSIKVEQKQPKQKTVEHKRIAETVLQTQAKQLMIQKTKQQDKSENKTETKTTCIPKFNKVVPFLTLVFLTLLLGHADSIAAMTPPSPQSIIGISGGTIATQFHSQLNHYGKVTFKSNESVKHTIHELNFVKNNTDTMKTFIDQYSKSHTFILIHKQWNSNNELVDGLFHWCRQTYSMYQYTTNE